MLFPSKPIYIACNNANTNFSAFLCQMDYRLSYSPFDIETHYNHRSSKGPRDLRLLDCEVCGYGYNVGHCIGRACLVYCTFGEI